MFIRASASWVIFCLHPFTVYVAKEMGPVGWEGRESQMVLVAWYLYRITGQAGLQLRQHNSNMILLVNTSHQGVLKQ